MKVLIACGGTAGHMFPGLALVEELKLKDNHCQITLVVSTHPRDRRYLEAAGYILNGVDIETVNTASLPYNFSPKFIFFAARLLGALLKSFFIILKHSPDVVVGFGGYASFAPLVMARMMRKPVVIHEQNLIPGRANQFLARIADRIAVSFQDTGKLFTRGSSRNKIVRTGLPLRKDILSYKSQRLSQFAESGEKFTILICGGSQGAHNINELMLDCLGVMDKKTLAQIRLVHLSGERDFDYVKQRYEALRLDSQVFAFLKEIAEVYKSADLMIGRAGAGTIFEAASFGLPCILIPYSGGTRHQKENASLLQRRGAALVLDEQNTTGEDLKRIVLSLIDNKRMRQNLSEGIRMLEVPQAGYNLKKEILTLGKGSYVS